MSNIFKSSIALAISFVLAACGGGGSSSSDTKQPPTPTNSAPIVSVNNVTANENTFVKLTANASDIDGDALTYSWTQTSGDMLSYTENGSSIDLLTPEVIASTNYSFEVSVSDGELSGSSSATITVNDVEAPMIAIENVSVLEGNQNHTVQLELMLSHGATKDIKINYITQNGTATQGEDYIATSGNLTILAGSLSYKLSLEIVGDDIFSNDNVTEQFRVVFADAKNAILTNNMATIYIENDDVPFVSSPLFEMQGDVDAAFTPFVFDAGLKHKVWVTQLNPYAVSGHRITQEMIDSGKSFSPFYIFTLNESNEVVDITSQLYKGDNLTDLHNVREAVVADFNGDGLEDVAFAVNEEDGRPMESLWVSENKILMSQPNGEYQLTPIIPELEDYTHSIALGDINNDGHTDLIVGSGGVDYEEKDFDGIYIALNNGTGQFTLSQSFDEERGDNWGSVHVADLDNDGINEIITGGWTAPYIRVFKKDADNVFQLALERQVVSEWDEEVHPTEPWRKSYFYESVIGYLSIGGIADIKTIDTNGNGYQDIVAYISVGSPEEFNPGREVRLWENHGDMVFVNKVLDSSLTRHQSGQFIQLVDVNYDSKLDIAFCNQMPNQWSLQSEAVYYASEDGAFELANPLGFSESSDDATCSVFEDINKDGILDVLQSDMHQGRANDGKAVNVLIGK